MPINLRLAGAGQAKTFALRVGKAIQPTTGDLLEVLARQQSRILERTERGLDYQGRPFAAYSSRGPYYYYPSGPVGQTRTAQARKNGKAGVARMARLGLGGTRTRSGFGLRFSSYRAFKLGYLGRSNVDLRGARAPHMLQQIVMQVGSVRVAPGSQTGALGPSDRPQPATRGTLGIYGEAGARAAGHNEGTRRLPQRRFFDMSDKDIDDAAELLLDRATARLLAALDGG